MSGSTTTSAPGIMKRIFAPRRHKSNKFLSPSTIQPATSDGVASLNSCHQHCVGQNTITEPVSSPSREVESSMPWLRPLHGLINVYKSVDNSKGQRIVMIIPRGGHSTKGSATNAHPAGASPEAMAQRTRHRTAGSKGPIGMSVGDAVEVCEHLQLLLPLVGIQGSCQRNAKLFLQSTLLE